MQLAFIHTIIKYNRYKILTVIFFLLDTMDQIVHNVAKRRSRQLLGADLPNFMYGDSKPIAIRPRPSRCRPHSSPERYTANKPRGHILNKSPSQQRRLRDIAPIVGFPANAHNIGEGEEFLAQRPAASAGLAYFANQPPLAPMHIVVVKRTPEGDPTILNSNAVTTSTEPNTSNYPDATTSTNLLKRSTSRGRSTVRHILRDLMSTMPLRLMSSPASQRRSPSPDEATTDMDSNLRTESASPAPRRHKHFSGRSPLNRHLSYKAIDQISETAGTGHTVSEKGEGTRPEDWMGGVRALRDSHVRLVLRQLRHIDRLNRALDRYTKVAANR